MIFKQQVPSWAWMIITLQLEGECWNLCLMYKYCRKDISHFCFTYKQRWSTILFNPPIFSILLSSLPFLPFFFSCSQVQWDTHTHTHTHIGHKSITWLWVSCYHLWVCKLGNPQLQAKKTKRKIEEKFSSWIQPCWKVQFQLTKLFMTAERHK